MIVYSSKQYERWAATVFVTVLNWSDAMLALLLLLSHSTLLSATLRTRAQLNQEDGRGENWVIFVNCLRVSGTMMYWRKNIPFAILILIWYIDLGKCSFRVHGGCRLWDDFRSPQKESKGRVNKNRSIDGYSIIKVWKHDECRENNLNTRSHANPKWDRTRCPEE